MVIQVGDKIPQATFGYVPWTPELEDGSACGVGSKLSTDEWKGKKVVLVSVPGAFTSFVPLWRAYVYRKLYACDIAYDRLPTCHVNHMPPFIQKYDELKAKGVDVVAFVAANDLFVMSAWGRVSGAKDKILFLSDPNANFASELGLAVDLSSVGFGTRTGRWAIVLDDLKVTYVGTDTQRGQVTGSSVETVLSKL